MSRKLIAPFLSFALVMLTSCAGFNLTDPPPTLATESPTETVTPPASSELTENMLRNATFSAPFSGQTVTLVDGTYQSGSDTASLDYLQVILDSHIAFGDLNFDGLEDAAVLLAEYTGGTGVFVSLIAVLNAGGAPLPAAATLVDDRPIINDLQIRNGEILLDTIIHGVDDPMCCPAEPVVEGFRLYNGNELVLSLWAGQTFDGQPRHINITNPVDLAGVVSPFTLNGSVTIGPFESTLGYSVYAPDNALVTSGSVMTDSPDMGLPGDFSLALDLSMAGVTGLVRIEFVEYSMADGSIMTLDSVLVDVR